jgi:hypothetical protein
VAGGTSLKVRELPPTQPLSDFHNEGNTFSLKCLAVLAKPSVVERRQQVVQVSAVGPFIRARLAGPSIALPERPKVLALVVHLEQTKRLQSSTGKDG